VSNNLFVIGGGGVRQLEAGLGAMMALEDAGFSCDNGRGSSAGAILLSLRMSGMSPAAIFDMFKKNPVESMIKRRWVLGWFFGRGIYDTAGLAKLLKDRIGSGRIENFVVTMTDMVAQDTVYAHGNWFTALCSMGIPEVFDPRLYTGDVLDGYDQGSVRYVEKLKVADGGVYDNIPTPAVMDAHKYDNVFIMASPNDVGGKERITKVGRGLDWMSRTTDRESRQVAMDWERVPNAVFMRPPDFPSSLLAYSEGFGLVEHARDHARKKIVQYVQKRSSGPPCGGRVGSSIEL
jgi:predicted acylesterase/phospholipase RssA